MNIKTPIILAIVLLILGGIATWDEWQTKKDKKAEEKKLTSFAIKDITKITYLNPGNDTNNTKKDSTAEEDDGSTLSNKKISLEKLDDVWRITDPLEAAADNNEVEDLIKTVLDYEYERVIAEKDANLEEFGLQNPQRSITLAGKEEKSYSLYLGNKSPVGYSIYLRTSQDERVYAGSQYVLTSTEKTLFNFRDKKLVEIESEAVNKITFWHKESEVYEVTRKDGKYQLVKPAPFKTSQEKVQEYIEEFNQVRIEKFIDKPEDFLVEKFKSADKIIMTAVFEFSSGEAKELTFVRDRGELLVAFEPTKIIFSLPATFEEKIKHLSENFRDHSVFSFVGSDVTEIDIDGRIYRRVEEDWYLHSDLDAEGNFIDAEYKPAANDSVLILLDSLETAEALEFLDQTAAMGVINTPPARKITLKYPLLAADGKDEETKTLEISFWTHPKSDDKYYLMHTDSKQVFVTPKSLLEGYTISEEKSEKSILENKD